MYDAFIEFKHPRVIWEFPLKPQVDFQAKVKSQDSLQADCINTNTMSRG